MQYFFIFLCVVFGLVKGDIVCPDVKDMENFEAEKISGTWYLAKHYQNKYTTGKCLKLILEYSEEYNCLFMDVMNLDQLDNIYNWTVVMVPIHNINDAYFANVVVGSQRRGILNVHVLDSDYENYLLFYGCDQKKLYAWIIVRDREAPIPKEDEINEIFKRNGVDPSNLAPMDQQKCPN